MSAFFRFNASADPQAATLSILDVIGLWGVQAADFRAGLDKVTAPVLNVEINSPGGDYFAGVAIFNMLRASGKTIRVKVLGIAASAAALVAMSGDTIEFPANAFLMIHSTSMATTGNAAAHRESAELLDTLDTSTVEIFRGRTGLPAQKVRELMTAETWFTAEEALALGFATEVTEAVETRATYATAHAAIPQRVVAALTAPKASSPHHAPVHAHAPTAADIWANRK